MDVAYVQVVNGYVVFSIDVPQLFVQSVLLNACLYCFAWGWGGGGGGK